jgi:hypothetical protein
MNYLLYIEHAAENLQFYLWHQDYVKRFNSADTSDLALAPEWTKSKEDELAVRLQKAATENVRQQAAAGASDIFKGTDFEKQPGDFTPTPDGDPFSTPPSTPAAPGDRDTLYAPSTQPSNADSYRSQASDAFAGVGAKIPCELTVPESDLSGHR